MPNTEPLVGGSSPTPLYQDEVYCEKRGGIHYCAQAFTGSITPVIVICLAFKDSKCEGCPHYHIFKS